MKAIPEYKPAATDIDQLGEPTVLERIEQNAMVAYQLRRVGSDEADCLADTLDGCRTNVACLSAACLVCSAAAQKSFVQTALEMWAPGVPLVHITIIPTEPQRDLNALGTLDLKSVRKHLKELLDEAGFGGLKVLAFIDLSHSVDHRAKREFWLPHYHLVAASEETRNLTVQFRTILPSSESVVRPVMMVMLNDPAVQLHYMSKPRPVRVTRLSTANNTTRPLKQWLKTREHLEAIMWLGRYSAMDRIIALPEPVKSSEASRNPRLG